MVYIVPRRIRDKLWPEPLSPPGSFSGQTVLVTGATAGLGLAAAVHFATLGARVVITSRSVAQGNAAKDEVERRADMVGQGLVHVFGLDMGRYTSCVEFVDRLKESSIDIDIAVLNAGLINADYELSPEGWEQTLQVNTLSTTLLGLLLLQMMREKPKPSDTANKSHLVFVTSRDHTDPDITHWNEWAAKEGILRHLSDRQNWPLDQVEPNYANSKLLLTYAVEAICKEAVGSNGRVDVIVNSVCPGLVFTSISRAIVKRSTFLRFAVPFFGSILAKSPDYGARFYVTAARTSEDEHGKYIQSLFGEEEYRTLAFPNLRSDVGLEVQVLAWSEIITELKKAVPALKDMKLRDT